MSQEEPETPAPQEMRAVVLTSFGGAKAIKTLTKPQPTPGPDQVLIAVKASGLNFQDLMARQGAVVWAPKIPFIMGMECAGVVQQLGQGVNQFKEGDRVIALPEYRAWAEYVTVPVQYVYPIPDEMSFTEASALAINYLVAYMLLHDVANVRPGMSLLLHSAGGGVGLAIGQLCRRMDNIKIFGVASKSKHESLTEVDHLIERGSDYVAEVKKISPEGVDIVLDCLCGEDCNKGLSLLKPMGKYVLYGSSNIISGETKSFFSFARSWWQVDKLSPIKLFDENKTVAGFNLRQLLFAQNKTDYIAEVIGKLIDIWKEGKIKPVIDSTWALEDVPEAMLKLQDRTNVGKVIIDLSLEPKPKPVTPAKGKNKPNDKEEKKKDEETNNAETNTSQENDTEEPKETEAS